MDNPGLDAPKTEAAIIPVLHQSASFFPFCILLALLLPRSLYLDEPKISSEILLSPNFSHPQVLCSSYPPDA